jgi:hypothetical protein
LRARPLNATEPTHDPVGLSMVHSGVTGKKNVATWQVNLSARSTATLNAARPAKRRTGLLNSRYMLQEAPMLENGDC